MDAIHDFLLQNRERHQGALADLVRIPSVSALNAHKDDMRSAAEWVADALRRAGAPEATVHETGGNPIVVGGWRKPADDAPTVLIYAHYDVQPPDPLDLWTSPPFEPVIRDGLMFGRGASDDKAGVLTAITACEALTQTLGRPPVGVTLLIEGEEEIGSPNLRAFMEQHRDELAADVVVSADSVMWDHDTPSLVLGGRGIAAADITLRTSDHDLHSGLFGGIAPNATLALAHLLATLVSPDGAIMVDGFYDGVDPASAQPTDATRKAPFDLEAMLAKEGIGAAWGEPGVDPLVRNWHRPTLEVNGFHGGFGGDGSKTVIPAEAKAKITCRLVPGHVPADVLAAIERHVEQHAPPYATVQVERHPGSAAAFALSRDDPALAPAAEALAAVYGHPPLEMSLGGTLPFADLVGQLLGRSPVMLGWSMPDERLHAPDEFFRLENLELGARVYAEFLIRLAG